MLRSTHAHARAFTLLELMVVIAIISILVGFSAPQFTRQIAKAKLVEAHTLAAKNKTNIEEFILVNGHFPSNSEFRDRSVAYEKEGLIADVKVEQVDGVTGTLTISLNASTGIEQDEYFQFHRDEKALWDCRSSLAVTLIPDHCSSLKGSEED